MKKLFATLIIAIITCFAIVGCTNSPDVPPSGESGNETSGATSGDTTESGECQQPLEQEITKVYLTINSNKLEVVLEKNSSVNALVDKLKKGDISYTANDYGGFEKVGGLGFSLPTNDTRITTQAGDVILYSGNQIVLFYGSNTWSYTRIGRIEGYSSSQLRSLLGAENGNVKVTLNLNK
ncbi:MAG: hypothetical protein K2M75_02705 [Clostridia bacterium]|nr:hypothetical protein [Clostridia bacterium]